MPWSANAGSKAIFVGAVCIILSMYGGGFATVPAYLADMFGTQFVGAIHGRLLTAWSTAGIIGPVVVNYIREAQLAAGVPRDHLYDYTLYILAGMLVIGLICNFLVKPVNPKRYMSADEVAKLQAARAKSDAAMAHGSFGIGKGGLDAKAGHSGLLSAFRSPGAFGSRLNRQWPCFNKYIDAAPTLSRRWRGSFWRSHRLKHDAQAAAGNRL